MFTNITLKSGSLAAVAILTLVGAYSSLASMPPDPPELSIVGTWKGKEPTAVLGNPAFYEIRMTFTADGKFTSRLTTIVTDSDGEKTLGPTISNGGYTYKPLQHKKGQLEVALKMEGSVFVRPQRGTVLWVNTDEFKYVFSTREITYRRQR